MNKKIMLRVAGVMAGVVLLINCAGCGSEPKPEKTSNNIEVENIEVEEIIVE